MKKIISLALILTFTTITFGQTSAENLWIGKYHHENDIGKEYFMLEIFRDGNKLKGRYKETVTAQTSNKFTLNITVKGNIASFFVDECLPFTKAEEDEGDINGCGSRADGFQLGALILKAKRVTKGKEISFKALGGTLVDAGFAGELNFVKTKKFYYSF